MKINRFKLIILLLFSICMQINKYTLAQDSIKATIKYTDASAKIEAFKDVETKISKDIYKDYLIDKNKKENLESLNKKIYEVNGERILSSFYIQDIIAAYAVVYYENPNYAFYYDIFGHLRKFEILSSQSYPRRTTGYSRHGNMISTSFEVDDNEQYIYNPKGDLIGHWKDDKLVNSNSKLIKRFNITRMGE